jgi:GH24 family phage-related lysozyme (muramidase)
MKPPKRDHAEGKEIAGLKTRREAELALWDSKES